MTNQQTNEDKAADREFILSTISEISEGVIGTASALIKLFEDFGYIEPHINAIKKMNLKGSLFWVMWKDVCEQNPAMFIAFLEDYSRGNINFEEDIEPKLNSLMERRDSEVAAGIRETYVQPAMHRLVKDVLNMPWMQCFLAGKPGAPA